jgi:hypothetical protein
MATVNTNYGQKDIVSPKLGHFKQTLSWTLDSTTNLPVGMSASYDFTDSTIGRPYDHDQIPYTVGVPQPVAPNKPSKLDLM